jgi:hypothetical protein
MPWGRTDEQKASDGAQRAAQKAQAQRERDEAKYWESPLGQADWALRNGNTFFQIEIPHTTLRGVTNAAYNSRTQASQRHHDGATDLLAQIEQLGWHLEHASWVYMQTGQNSRDKFLASGQQVVVSGEVVGIYLFRRT